jgi:hypothetical protein
MSSGFAFGDPKPSPDNYDTFNPKDVFADSGINVTAVPEAIPKPWRTPSTMTLDQVIGAAAVQTIQKSGSIVFHCLGDSGGVKEPAHQFAVADAMTADLSNNKGGRPSFLFHLGDVVYYFGQEVYYFDQYYDPYRDYNAPIFAIPGNHDGVMFPKETAKYSLEPFWNNFCTKTPAHLLDAQGCARTTMTQPGAYFTLDAPFVKIIGLYSNTSELVGTLRGPGNDTKQINFLTSQLQAAVAQRKQGDLRALVIAVHHPPFTGSTDHFPSAAMLTDIDAACKQAGIMPDLVLSGHAHLYERYIRTVSGREIPYTVAGNGGYYDLSSMKTGKNGAAPKPGAKGTDGQGNPLVLMAYAESTFGFLRIAVDAKSISLEAIGVDEQSGKTSSLDSCTVDLVKHTVSDAGSTGKTRSAAARKGELPESATVTVRSKVRSAAKRAIRSAKKKTNKGRRSR